MLRVTMSDYSQESWVELYRHALLELKHSLMAGRLMDARAEIVKRVEKLRGVPGLHAEEKQAIEDALNAMRMLEREEARHAAEQQRNLAYAALQKLQAIEPAIARLESKTPEAG
jgi:hypothetical protein